jgi:O-antigen/teichoic acid export membrane protein
MLSKMDTFAAVGVYGVAYKFVDLLHYLPTAMLAPVLALLVRSWPDDLPRFADTFRRALVLLAAGGVLVAVEFAVFSRPLVSLLYGNRYAVGAPAAALVVGAECLNAFGRLAMTVLVAMGRHRLYPMATLAGLVTNVALNLWLIPARSYEGAALATVVTEVLVVGVLLVPVVRMDVLRPLPVRALASVAVAGVVAELVAVSSWSRVPWPLAAGLAAAAYAAVVGAALRRRGAYAV